jgi:antitoxin (DNA-binding transcriptional repressor) of toxin-antitoxin stability system
MRINNMHVVEALSVELYEIMGYIADGEEILIAYDGEIVARLLPITGKLKRSEITNEFSIVDASYAKLTELLGGKVVITEDRKPVAKLLPVTKIYFPDEE